MSDENKSKEEELLKYYLNHEIDRMDMISDKAISTVELFFAEGGLFLVFSDKIPTLSDPLHKIIVSILFFLFVISGISGLVSLAMTTRINGINPKYRRNRSKTNSSREKKLKKHWYHEAMSVWWKNESIPGVNDNLRENLDFIHEMNNAKERWLFVFYITNAVVVVVLISIIAFNL